MSLPRINNLDTHERTVISRQNNALESELSFKLNAVVKVIRELIKEDPSIQSVDRLKAAGGLEAEVYDIIRSYVQKSYELGTKYVTDIAKIEPRLTSSDIERIKAMSDDFAIRFWGRVQKAIFESKMPSASNNPVITDQFVIPNDSFHSNFIVNSLSIAITSMALNEATKAKTSANLSTILLRPLQQEQQALRGDELQAAATYKSLHDRIIENYGNVPYSVSGQYRAPNETITIQMPSVIPENIVYMWIATIDERTCPLCVSLHGSTWDLTDAASIPDIPDSTHYNCRCRVMLVEASFAAQVAEQQAVG